MAKVDIPSYVFAKIYPMYINKAERKDRSKYEVDEILCWLTGYDQAGLEDQIAKGTTIREFFESAPAYNPNADLIKGVVCGIRVEDIEDPLIQKARKMDKLIDELAKGKKWKRFCGLNHRYQCAHNEWS
jgi:hypothetical protein